MTSRVGRVTRVSAGVEGPSAASGKTQRDFKWGRLKHNGVAFPLYEPHNLTLTVREKVLKLTPEQEEMAWAWVKKKDTPYVKDEVFTSNFLADFRKVLPPEYAKVKIGEIDFSDIARYQEETKSRESSPEVKKKLAAERKEKRLALKERFGYAEIDGHRVEVANYMVEPPGIFMGRGNHPLRGSWKQRIYPKDVILNLGKEAPIPPGEWKKIVHDKTSMWLASWFDPLTEKMKYVWLHDSSDIRQQRDRVKYDNAKKLTSKLEKVRRNIRRGMSSKDEKTRKIATVCYLIDRLCMRVGDEKDEDEADTVGASTLRVEHIKLTPHAIQLNFLGKDSVPWSKSISVSDEDSVLFRKNLERFAAGKKPEDLLFDGVKSSNVNKFLGRSTEGLTAKVFRTFHATNVAQDNLLKHSKFRDESDFLKLYYAKRANLQVAVTCNHKRTPPKNWEESLAKKREKLKQIRARRAKTEKARKRREESVLKADLAIKLAEETRDYNLNTSLRNYIDPRVYKSWADHVTMDWRKIYPATLQRKFSWVGRSSVKWPPSR